MTARTRVPGSVHLSTLGRLDVVAGAGEPVDLARRPGRAAVLVYLACERVTTREKLLGVFWPDRPAARGRHALNQTLHVLRRELGAGWLGSQGEQLRATDALRVDAHAFEEAVDNARWEEALRVYRGRFLDGLYLVDTSEFEQWVALRRRRLEELHYEVHRQRLAQRRREPAAALAAARAWAAAYPDLEEPAREMVRGLAAAVGRDLALREWERFQRRIEEQDLPEGSASWQRLGARLRSTDADDFLDDEAEDRRGRTAPWRGTPLRGPRLVRIVDGEEAESFRLPVGETRIGREQGDITFPEDRAMSTLHALFRVEEVSAEPAAPGAEPDVVYRCTVRDAGSRNGVYLRIREDWPLGNGDAFAAGRQRFRYEGGGEARR